MATGKKDKKSVNDNPETTNMSDKVQDTDSMKGDSAKGVKDKKSPEKEIQDKKAKKKKETIKEPGSDKGDVKIKSAEKKLSEIQDKYIRLSAEFDNYRKRTLKEKMELVKSAGESILNNILPVMDDFDRAMGVMDEATDCKAMKEGIDLIYNKFQEFLKQNGLKEIEAVNLEFDTDLHEAVTKIPAPSDDLKGKIVDVIQKGYFLNDKVIRYSKVVVGE